MSENLLLVLPASLSSFSANSSVRGCADLNEHTKSVIACELKTIASQTTVVSSEESVSMEDNYFMDGDMNWTDSASSWYWDDDWSHYNCYSYAIPRHDLVPDYYPPEVTLHENFTKWYNPGQFCQNFYYPPSTTIGDIAQRVVDDFNAIGFTNVSAFRLNGLPALSDGEELIALRRAPGDTHFMRYCKADGYWYHKPDQRAVIKYKYQLSESRVWSYEALAYGGVIKDGPSYTGEIWLVKYTPVTLAPTYAADACETIFLDRFGDRVLALDIDDPGLLNVSFSDTTAFTAALYSSEWCALGSVTHEPIEAMLFPGRYYLVVKNYRYSNYVSVNTSLTAIPGHRSWQEPNRQIVFSEKERLVRAYVDGEGVASLSAVELSGENGVK